MSASPASAADISQTVADVVFQGKRLAPVARLIAHGAAGAGGDAAEPGAVDRLQRGDGAAGGGGLRHALAGGGGDVEFVAAGDGEQFPRCARSSGR